MKQLRDTPDMRRGLEDWVVALGASAAGHVVEVGSFAGESARIIAPMVGRLTCVDPYIHYPEADGWLAPGDLEEAKAAMLAFLDDARNVTLIQLPSVEAAEMFKAGSLDAVYIDGDHSEEAVRADIRAWLPKIKPGGWIGGHDYRADCNMPVIRAVDALLGKPAKVFADSSWLHHIPDR